MGVKDSIRTNWKLMIKIVSVIVWNMQRREDNIMMEETSNNLQIQTTKTLDYTLL